MPEFDDYTIPLRGALTVEETDEGDETVDICTGFPLLAVWLMALNGCDRQDPAPKAVKELPQLPDTTVGGVARSAIDKAKGVETTLGQAGNRTAEASKEGTP